jgi:hypothetical protein
MANENSSAFSRRLQVRGLPSASRLDVADQGRKPQPAAVDIRSQRTPQAHAIDARLLLPDGPRPRPARLAAMKVVDQRRPLDAGLDLDGPAVGVEPHNVLELPRVQQHGVAAELLAAHRVAAAGHADVFPLAVGVAQGAGQLVDRPRRDDPGDARGVELRLNVVHVDARGRRVGGCGVLGTSGAATRRVAGYSIHSRQSTGSAPAGGGAKHLAAGQQWWGLSG